MIITVNSASWLGKSRVNVTFQEQGNIDTGNMSYDDLCCIIEKLPTIITDVFWLEKKTIAPSWFIEQKRQCVFANNQRAREIFGFEDDDIQNLAAIFTNNLELSCDITVWMFDKATPEMVKKYGIAKNIAIANDNVKIPDRLSNLLVQFEKLEMSR